VAKLAVLASGNGSNFQAIAQRLEGTQHVIACMICDRKAAPVFARAHALGIPGYRVSYLKATREEVEQEVLGILNEHRVELVVLAGYMRLLSSLLVDAYPGRIVNIHPSLLPSFPGTNAIEESFESKDYEMGVTVHRVDYGMDTGPVIVQRSLSRIPGETLEQAEQRIHALEHQIYPEVVMNILEDIEKSKQFVCESDRRTL